MAPLMRATARSAATTAEYHKLAARGISSDNVTIMVCILCMALLLSPIFFYKTRKHFKSGGTIGGYIWGLIRFLIMVPITVVLAPLMIVMALFGMLKAPKPSVRASGAGIGAGTGATANPRVGAVAEPPPLARPTMPLDPVELAPEEDDLGDPDDPTSYLRRGPPPAAAAAGDDNPPSFEAAVLQKPEAAVLRPSSSPPPDYQPTDPSRPQGQAP